MAQVTIPTDAVDPAFTAKPRRWDVTLIRDFMLVIGPISSLYDFLTFAALLWLFGATEPLFRTGWFVESLATQTLVLFVIRTAGNPLRSRPSAPLVVTVLAGVALPFTPPAGPLGFVPLPGRRPPRTLYWWKWPSGGGGGGPWGERRVNHERARGRGRLGRGAAGPTHRGAGRAARRPAAAGGRVG
jgi:hypothetical protein